RPEPATAGPAERTGTHRRPRRVPGEAGGAGLMRFVTYASAAGDDRVGLVDGDQVRGLEPDLTLLDLLEADGLAAAAERATASPSEVVPLAGLTLRAPLQPRSLRDFTGFLQHLRNCQAAAD